MNTNQIPQDRLDIASAMMAEWGVPFDAYQQEFIARHLSSAEISAWKDKHPIDKSV